MGLDFRFICSEFVDHKDQNICFTENVIWYIKIQYSFISHHIMITENDVFMVIPQDRHWVNGICIYYDQLINRLRNLLNN
jgi:hypothetical protein